MKNLSVTAVIPALNEEKNIERCIKSLLWCDKVQVLWMGTDKTGDIAKSLGAEVVELNKSAESNFIAVQKNINWAIDHATTDWILRVDADEVVTPELQKEIITILNLQKVSTNLDQSQLVTPIRNSSFVIHNSPVAYGIPRSQYFMGGFLKGGDWSYDRLVRLFRPKFARFDPVVEVHEQFKVNGPIGFLKNPLLHYSHPTLKDAIRKFDVYTTLEAKEVKDSIFIAFFKMTLLPIYIFARWMIWHGGYRDGFRGIVAGIFRGYYDFLLYKKYIFHKK